MQFTRSYPLLLLAALIPGVALLNAAERTATESHRFAAAEAGQGVAVDADHVYAIANKEVGKYDRRTGRRVARWESDRRHPLTHVNGGIIHEGRLYCAHSNYPAVPMTSSVEIWDADSLAHVDTHSFGITDGSLTWVERHDDAWWAVFAHYAPDPAAEHPARDVRWTTLVRLDDEWRRRQAWTFPPEVVRRFVPYSNSGGSWGADGLLYCTGHDRRELYALRLPRSGSALELVETIKVPFAGQGIAWDRSRENTLLGIDRGKREVVFVEITSPE